MKRIAFTAVVAGLLALPVAADAAPSVCKGLDEAACSMKASECAWQKALKAGDITKAGQPSKVTRKAHCRVKRPAASKQ